MIHRTGIRTTLLLALPLAALAGAAAAQTGSPRAGAGAGARQEAGSAAALRQDSGAAALDTAASAGSPVVLGGDTLFRIRAPLGPFSPAQRAAATRERLLDLARNPFARLDTVRVVEAEGRSDLMLNDLVLGTVTDADAALAGRPRAELARAHAVAIAAALERSALATNVKTALAGAAYTLLATVALILLLRMINPVFPRLHRLVRRWEGTRIRSLRLQNLEVISAERFTRLISGLVTLVRGLVTLLLGYVYLLLVFSFFPWTRGVAGRLVQYAMEPIVNVFQGFVAYVPSLFYIVVILGTMYYVLKVIRLIFDGLGSGAIAFRGFYSDWADPTYKIIRFIAIALTLILIWPHLPSSDRPEFRGVAAFVGLLLSLGSASAVSNVIGGVVMVYMRPFQLGDRVRIADTVGDVVEKNLLVTRVRTTKNVDITIPNSMVLSSHLINYSSTASEGGLVLHTTVTLGYELPWRTVHETLISAALATTGILRDPHPFVLQTALNDFHVSYELNAYTAEPGRMTRVYSELHQNIQDACAAAGIEILSPAYEARRDGSASTIPPVAS